MFGFIRRLWDKHNPESGRNLLVELMYQLDDLDKNGEYTEVGLVKDSMISLLGVLANHELSITPRALLIYVKGWLDRHGKKLEDVLEEQAIVLKNETQISVVNSEVASQLKSAMNPSSSISRAIPIGMALRDRMGDAGITLFDLGSGRAHCTRVLLEHEMFDDAFFQKFRVHVQNPAEQLANVQKVVGVDTREVDFDESVQIYKGRDEKLALFEKIEEKEDHEGRYEQIISDIRQLTAKQIEKATAENTTPVLYIGNLLFQVRGRTRKKLEKAINKLARKTGAQIIQMETWSAFHDEKQEETINGEAVASPAYLRMGTHLSDMQTVAILDGTTGKPFDLITKEGKRVHIAADGNRVEIGKIEEPNTPSEPAIEEQVTPEQTEEEAVGEAPDEQAEQVENEEASEDTEPGSTDVEQSNS